MKTAHQRRFTSFGKCAKSPSRIGPEANYSLSPLRLLVDDDDDDDPKYNVSNAGIVNDFREVIAKVFSIHSKSPAKSPCQSLGFTWYTCSFREYLHMLGNHRTYRHVIALDRTEKALHPGSKERCAKREPIMCGDSLIKP